MGSKLVKYVIEPAYQIWKMIRSFKLLPEVVILLAVLTSVLPNAFGYLELVISRVD